MPDELKADKKPDQFVRLSNRDDWSKAWKNVEQGSLEFNYRVPSFADIDSLLIRTLPKDDSLRFLEIGCCPGQYLWYFHERFGYQPSGLDYLEKGCEETRSRCRSQNLDCDIIHADLFDFHCSEKHPPWDVIASFGLVEHFDDILPCLNRHLDLVKVGGLVVIVIPNHTGLNGKILKVIDPELHHIHNLMSWKQLKDGFIATQRAEILEGGHYGRVGFWNAAVYGRARKYGKVPYLAVRAPLWAVEHMGRVIPNSSFLSPNIAVVARRCD